uniref:Thioredoxin-like fold domain-containing protein n=1 Tax=Ditylum brightwellii TaxID=49249 RepID=A0A7S1YVU1_9STRA
MKITFSLFPLFVAWSATTKSNAFQQSQTSFLHISTNMQQSSSRCSSSALHMGAFNRKNKQLELQKKMAQAKKLRQGDPSPTESEKEKEKKKRLSDEKMKVKNDRQRFEELLEKETASFMGDYDETGYKSLSQLEEETDALAAGIDRLFEGDPAPIKPFHSLISSTNSKPLGEYATNHNILPWLHPTKPNNSDYVLLITDPRAKSSELRELIQQAYATLPSSIKSKIMFISSDGVGDMKKFMKKNKMELEVWKGMYCDENKSFMREYTALGEKRWSMSMFILADGRVQKLVRDLDGVMACKVIVNAVKSLEL